MASSQTANLTKLVPVSFVNIEDDHNVVKPPRPRAGLGQRQRRGPAHGRLGHLEGAGVAAEPPSTSRGTARKTPSGTARSPPPRSRRGGHRLREAAVLQRPSASGPRKAAHAKLEPGKPGIQTLLWDAAAFGLLKARKADVYSREPRTTSHPSSSSLTRPSRPARSSRQRRAAEGVHWSAGPMLVDYTQRAKGPRSCRARSSCRRVTRRARSTRRSSTSTRSCRRATTASPTPTANGFNKSVYTSNGYAVLMPDITYTLNDPGMSAVVRRCRP